MMKFFIKNRKKQKVCVLVEEKKKARGLVFVMHGLGGFKESDPVQSVAKVFNDLDFTTVLSDTTNSIGESGGKYEKATTTSYYEDLVDVIGWAKKQKWYVEPFVLVGFSLGGFSVAYYAENYPKKVVALLPISPVVSGQLSLEARKRHDPAGLKDWKKTGWFVRESLSKPGKVLKLPWSYVMEKLKYDLLPNAKKITMPVLLVVGEKDESTPVDQVKLLYRALSGPKETHVIKGAEHVFRTTKHLGEMQSVMRKWVKKYIL